MLDVQGLRTEKPCNSVKEVAQRIHSIQVDTISVVSRSHNLITFNRFKDYKDGSIWEYQKNGELFEYWSHSMCLMPIETYPLSAWRKTFYQEEMWSSFRKWSIENEDIIKQILQKVKDDGEVNSASLGEKKSKPSSGWWDWKVEKRALEYLFYIGELMVAYRQGFQKYYDIPERVLPAGIDTQPLTDDEAAEYIVNSTLGSLGLGTHQDIRSYHGSMPAKKLWNNKKDRIEAYLDTLVKEGELEEVHVAGLKDRYYMLASNGDRLHLDPSLSDESPVKILSPFDNVMRERHLPKRVWDFDYTIECYVPPAKRIYGYFVLPILDGIDLAGRLDAKAHRKEKQLEVKSIYLEKEAIKSKAGLERLKSGLIAFQRFHECDAISVGKVSPRNMTKQVRAILED
ncbi:MAG: YcaQ family DNA glycosylase [Candidatus Thorarchaeota archaeon]|nr:YcaQ family DNA glycosylase [Candidatus Thorarchaeota archaeon]